MASQARKAFDANIKDVTALIELYETVVLFAKNNTEKTSIEPSDYDVVLRSAIVLIVTYWEAYIEDIIQEAVNHLVAKVQSSEELPKELKKTLATEIKKDSHELAVWQLAGEGWRKLLQSRLVNLADARNRSFNTPKAQQTVEFVERALGLEDISLAWSKDDLQPELARKGLDMLVEIRGQIAHRGKIDPPITLATVENAKNFITKLVSKTGGAINSHLKKHAKQGLW